MRVRTLLIGAALATAAFSFADVTVSRVKTIDQFHVTAAATAYSGPLIAFATEDNTVRIFDTKAMQTKFQMTGHPQTVQAIAFNRAGTLLATGDATARLYLWDVKTGKKVREFPRDHGHTKGIIAVAFSPDGQKIATVGNDDVIKVWKTAGGNPIGTILGKGANLYGIAFTSSGSILTGTLADGLRIYSGTTYECVAKMPVPGGEGVNSIAANKDGSIAVTADRDGTFMLWSVAKRQKIQTMRAHSDWVINAAVSPNGKLGASSSSDRTVVVWNLATGQKVTTLNDTSAVGSPVGFTGDGRYLVTTNASDGLSIYSVSPAQSGGAASTTTHKRKK